MPNISTGNTSNNKLAPGQTGYFDIIINPEETDVAIQYTVNFDTTNLPTGISITNYEIIEDAISNTFENTSIVGEINLTDKTKALSSSDTKTVRIYWEWAEDTTYIPPRTENYNIIVSISVKQKI